MQCSAAWVSPGCCSVEYKHSKETHPQLASCNPSRHILLQAWSRHAIRRVLFSFGFLLALRLSWNESEQLVFTFIRMRNILTMQNYLNRSSKRQWACKGMQKNFAADDELLIALLPSGHGSVYVMLTYISPLLRNWLENVKSAFVEQLGSNI